MLIVFYWSSDSNSDFTSKDCLFGSVKLGENADPDKYVCVGYIIWFNLRSEFSLPGVDKNVIIVGNDMSILIIRKKIFNSWKRFNTKIRYASVEAQYSVNFSRSNRKSFLSLHYNGNYRFLFVNATKIHHFKAKDSKKRLSLVFRRFLQLIT